MSLYNVPAGRSEDQRRYMEELEGAEVCIFCHQHFQEHHREPIEMKGHYWYVTKNDYPYPGSKHHYLIVPFQHVASVDELPAAAGLELFSLVRRLKNKLGTVSEAIVMRSGDMRLNGGSVEHLHAHFVVGDIDSPGYKDIRFRVSSRPDGSKT